MRPGHRFPSCLTLALVVCLSTFGKAQNTTSTTSLTEQSTNNTSACDANSTSSYCVSPFTGVADATGVYNAVPAPVSTVDIHELLYAGNNTRIFTHLMPWFCMDPATSTATGKGTVCQSHMQVGYNSNDTAVVRAQMDDMRRRGFDGTVIDWYGTQLNPALDATTLKVRDDLSARCTSAQNCPMYFAINYDQGSFQWTACPQDGGGVDQTQCIINAMNADFDYMNVNYFNSDAYTRLDNTNMSITPQGKPVVYFFVCESCFTNPSPNWSLIWAQLRMHVNTYGGNTPNIYFIFRNSGAFTHVESDGAFAWPNWYGSNDPYGFVYLDNFYDVALGAISKDPKKITVGAAYKGFNATSSSWGNPRIIQQQCGNTWLQSFQHVTHNNDFGASHQLPFMQIATWNDYEEGTEIETGIDNCLTVNASVSGTTLSWTPNFSDPSGSEATVHHYVVFDSTDGSTLKSLGTFSTSTHSLDLTKTALSQGAHTFYVQAVGQPSVQNKMSAGVSFTPGALQSIAVAQSSLNEGQSTTSTVTLASAAPAGGAAVTLASSDPAVQIANSVTIPEGANSVTTPVTTSRVTSVVTSTLSATYSGVTQTTSLTVRPITVSLALSPATLQGGNTSTGTLTLSSAAPAGGVLVQLASNNAAAQVPANVTVVQGATSATFTISTRTVTSSTAASISATYAGATQSASLTINAGTALASVTLSPTSVGGGVSSKASITLNAIAPTGGAVVQLTSSNTLAANVPASVTVAAGATSATVTVTTSAVSGTSAVSINASYAGSTKSANLTVNVTPASVTLSPSSVKGGTISTGTVTLSGPAPASGTSVSLKSSSTFATVSSSVQVPAGSRTASFTITTKVTSTTKYPVITASSWSVSKKTTLTVTK